MGAGNKSQPHRKKRISKHILARDAAAKLGPNQQSSEEVTEENKEATLLMNAVTTDKRKMDDDARNNNNNNNKSANTPKRHEKSTAEVSAYLSSWKYQGDGSGWKFNKNTQSWLIRHMYDAGKVPKATFSLLTEYLATIKGLTLRNRIQADATRRALRFKQWETTQRDGAGTTSPVGETAATDDNTTAEETTIATSVAGSSDDTMEQDDDGTRWKQLNDHDKRKEYKRSRKIIEILRDTK